MRLVEGSAARAAVAMASVSWLLAGAYVSVNRGFGSGDLIGFAFWSGLAGAGCYPWLHFFGKRTSAWSSSLAYAAAVVLAAIYAYVWTRLVALVLGPWIMAFSFPVFACWLTGATCAFLSSVLSRRPGTWLAAAVLAVGVPTVLLASPRAAEPEPPPELLIVFAAEATPDQIERAWQLFHAAPTATPEGYNPEGFRTVSRDDTATNARLRVTFHASSDPEARRAAIARAIASPLIDELIEIEDKDGVKTQRILKNAPPNNALQRTKPAQTMELRR